MFQFLVTEQFKDQKMIFKTPDKGYEDAAIAASQNLVV